MMAGTDGLLILLVDQARVETADLVRLVDRWRRHHSRPAAAQYQGRAAVPAIIPRRHFAALRELEGDTGARKLLQRLERLSLVAMPTAAFDIDTPQDVAALNPLFSTGQE
jgi:molybdenum cofactor cytidylyltransferase